MNGLLSLNQKTISREMKILRDINHTSTIPAKRRTNNKNHIETDGLFGGYKIQSYMEVTPIAKRAAVRGHKSVTLLEASISSVASRFEDIECSDPRHRLVEEAEFFLAKSRLHVIEDKTETSSLLDLAKIEDESHKSPTKKSPRPIDGLMDSPVRLSDSVVKLLPASTPQVELSPVKSPGTPSTPFIDSPSRVGVVQPSSPLASVGTGVFSSPLTHVPSLTPGPTLHFCAPGYDTSSTMEQSAEQFSPVQLSPIKGACTGRQTPAEVTNTEAIPPQHVTTPQQTDHSDLGLVAAIPASLPRLVPSGPVLPVDTTQLNFGPSSPSFNSSTWVDNTIATRPKRAMKHNGRRKSEPLVRSCIRSQAARRQTISPNEYVFNSEAVFNTANSPVSTPVPGHNDTALVDVDRTPEQPISPDVALNMVTPSIHWDRMNGRVSGGGVGATPGYNRAIHMNGVHNVDMRQNPDIFGAPAKSTPSSPTSINRLADMAVERCGGQANVLVSEENGRLIVRFKLPTEYAHLFPNNQGMDDSHFTTTPSVISSTPRIARPKTKSPEMKFSKRGISPSVGRPALPALACGEDATLVVSDFVTSPMLHSSEATALPPIISKLAATANSSEESSESSLSEMDHTPTITALNISGPSTAQQQGVPVEQKNTAPVSTPTGTPVLNTSFTPVNRFGFQQRPSPVSASPKPAEITQRLTEQDHQVAQSNNYEDSPGRDYMRDFIKRTSRKRTSTTAAGSPIAPPAKRAPLGIKSPNVESPQKGKRKAERDEPTSVGPMAKKARQTEQPLPEKKSSKFSTEDGQAMVKTNVTANAITTTNDSGARRSTRLRSQQPVSTTRSSIPTPIKLGGRPGTGRGGLNSTTRNEEKALSNKTRKNTLKNRGNAEYPAQVLARYQEQRLGNSSGEENREPDASLKSAHIRKSVGWRTPLEAPAKGKRITRSSTRVRT